MMKDTANLCTIELIKYEEYAMKITDMRALGAGLLGILAGLYFDLIYTWENAGTFIVVGLSLIGLIICFSIIQMLARGDAEVSKFLFVIFFFAFAVTFIVTWIIYLI